MTVEFVPGYWMNETSGVLRPAVEAYLEERPMTPELVAAMKAYLRQWMAADWRGEAVAELRGMIDHIRDRDDISEWLSAALDRQIDPL